jgi:hypothetical protein
LPILTRLFPSSDDRVTTSLESLLKAGLRK